MICPYCGKNIKDGTNTCPLCGKPTEFSARFFHVPEPSPLTRGEPPKPSPPDSGEQSLEELISISERINNEHQKIEYSLQKTIEKLKIYQRRSYLIHGIISVAAVLLILVFSLIGLRMTKNAMKDISAQIETKSSVTVQPNSASTPEMPSVTSTPEPNDAPADEYLLPVAPTFKPGLGTEFSMPQGNLHVPAAVESIEGAGTK